MSYRSNRVRQMYPIAVRSQDDRPRNVRTTFVGVPFFHGRTVFFRKKLVLGPKFLPDQNFRHRASSPMLDVETEPAS